MRRLFDALDQTSQAWAPRAALGLRGGLIVKLGIGIPMLVADGVLAGSTGTQQSQNGLLGIGPVRSRMRSMPT